MIIRNIDIRDKAKQQSIRLWEIGDSMGMTDMNFSRLLRRELDEKTKRRIFTIIEELKQAELLETE